MESQIKKTAGWSDFSPVLKITASEMLCPPWETRMATRSTAKSDMLAGILLTNPFWMPTDFEEVTVLRLQAFRSE